MVPVLKELSSVESNRDINKVLPKWIYHSSLPALLPSSCSFFFFFNVIYFYFWCTEFSLWWLLLLQSTSPRVQGLRELWHTGWVAPWDVESSWTRDRSPELAGGSLSIVPLGKSPLFLCMLCTATLPSTPYSLLYHDQFQTVILNFVKIKQTPFLQIC